MEKVSAQFVELNSRCQFFFNLFTSYLLAKGYFLAKQNKYMVKLRCQDYGFDCEFEADGDAETVISNFGDHTLNEHGIEYPKEAIMQFILRKGFS